MSNLVVVGTQWGDEGKGKIVDILAEFADLVVRFQGGANAGHTLMVNGAPLVTHLVPSGVLHPGKRCVIGPAVVIDPEALAEEIAMLRKRGLLADPGALLISSRAHLVMPYHKLLDAAREKSRGASKIGTTLRGIGPCLEDKVSRSGIRVCDLMLPGVLEARLKARLPEINALLGYYEVEPLRVENLLPKLHALAAQLGPFVADTGEILQQEMTRGRNLLFEGAQGTLLDVDHGTYPFVTSSNTVAAAACVGMGIGPAKIKGVMGVFKAYCTRVGEGPFPTELRDPVGQQLQAKGREFGATTGRPRRCGWLDLVALQHAANINGCSSLCLTKLDVLGGLNPIRVAVGYRLDGEELTRFPADVGTLARVEPVYEDLEGWTEDIRQVRERDSLPTAARRFIERVEHQVQIPMDIISVGPDRSETLVVHNPFRS